MSMSNGEDWITIVLVVAFVLSATITAGLLLRSMLVNTASTDQPVSLSELQSPIERPRSSSLAQRSSNPTPIQADLPAWARHIAAQQQATERDIDAVLVTYAEAINHGDRQAVFACQTSSLNDRLGGGAEPPLNQPLIDPVHFERTALQVDTPQRVFATVTSTSQSLGALATERFTFVFDPGTDRWQISAIDPL